MQDTFFFPPPEKCSHIASHYEIVKGRLRRYEGDLNPQWNRPEGCRAYANAVRYARPAWGLLSTAADYGAFLQMTLDGGRYKGVRILSPASVRAMTTVHTGERVGAPDRPVAPLSPRLGRGAPLRSAGSSSAIRVATTHLACSRRARTRPLASGERSRGWTLRAD